MRQAIRRELHALWHDPWGLALASYVPLISILGLWWCFSAGIPRQLPVAVVDNDRSVLSRLLIRYIDANPASTSVHFIQLNDAIKAMRNADVFALVKIPKNFRKDISRGRSPTLDIRYNGEFLLVGKLLSNSLYQSLTNGLLVLAQKKQRYDGVVEPQIDINIMPITHQITPLFNRNINYVSFLVPPILISLFQILAILMFANSLNRELNDEGYDRWLSQNILSNILAKFVVYTPIAIIEGMFIISLLYVYLHIPIAGSIALLIVAQAIMLMALWLVALCLFFLMQDSTVVISMCSALTAPAFAFMGITFPLDDMPWIARLWRLLMPSSHYIESHIGIVSYGMGVGSLFSDSLNYWYFLLLLPVIHIMIRLRQSKSEKISITESSI